MGLTDFSIILKIHYIWKEYTIKNDYALEQRGEIYSGSV